jgi:hypothetical protein
MSGTDKLFLILFGIRNMLEMVPDIAESTHGIRNIFADIRNVPTRRPHMVLGMFLLAFPVHVAPSHAAYRLCEVSAHEISSDRPDLSLFGLSVFRPPPPRWGGKCSRLARPFSSDLKPCLTMGKPEVKLTFN